MTIEWRLHSGTVNWTKIKNWILATQRWVEHAVTRSCHYRPEPMSNTQAGLNSLLVTTGASHLRRSDGGCGVEACSEASVRIGGPCQNLIVMVVFSDCKASSKSLIARRMFRSDRLTVPM